ncbi:hypothetical protein D3273_01205 [Lichenibacterium minor]|uniref:Uncharacterized protein n=1 Tax=Lichenibacterium minor TaxID=2316528 RepID=A0A4Q2UAK1_9HYPH|nr:hypothetical protein [Lichenibacterium minor]RYC33899.1 hypothetical protein D3273_01205 [Lichenibacterium minor]
MYIDSTCPPLGAQSGSAGEPPPSLKPEAYQVASRSPSVVVASTEEELEEALQGVKKGSVDAIRCKGIVVPGVKETFDYLLEHGNGIFLDALVGLPAAVQTVFTDYFERSEELSKILHGRDFHKLLEFIRSFKFKHPVMSAFSAVGLAYAIYRGWNSRKRRREVIEGKPFGPACDDLFRHGYRVHDNNGDEFTLRNDVVPRQAV